MNFTSNLGNKEGMEVAFGDERGSGSLTGTYGDERVSAWAENPGSSRGEGVEVDGVMLRSEESGVFGLFLGIPWAEQSESVRSGGRQIRRVVWTGECHQRTVKETLEAC